jgi:hypothetical protein
MSGGGRGQGSTPRMGHGSMRVALITSMPGGQTVSSRYEGRRGNRTPNIHNRQKTSHLPARMRGAGDRDRTGMASLEGWGSTIELRPHAPRRRSGLSVPGASFGVRRERRPRWDPDGRVGCALHHSVHRGVAQLGSALALGARGRGFESRHPDPLHHVAVAVQ